MTNPPPDLAALDAEIEEHWRVLSLGSARQLLRAYQAATRAALQRVEQERDAAIRKLQEPDVYLRKALERLAQVEAALKEKDGIITEAGAESGTEPAPRWGYSDSELVRGLLIEYGDSLTKRACDECVDCGRAVMCSFHSLLSALARRTALTDDAIAKLKAGTEPAQAVAAFDAEKLVERLLEALNEPGDAVQMNKKSVRTLLQLIREQVTR